MNSNTEKNTININDNKYLSWKLCLKEKLKNIKSNLIEVDSKDINLSCKDILEIVEIHIL